MGLATYGFFYLCRDEAMLKHLQIYFNFALNQDDRN